MPDFLELSPNKVFNDDFLWTNEWFDLRYAATNQSLSVPARFRMKK
jgi:hypothetical protein